MYGNAAKKLEIKESRPKTVLRDAEKKTSMWFTKHVCVCAHPYEPNGSISFLFVRYVP